MAQVKRLFGLNNVEDPLALGTGWLVTADNVDVTNAGKVVGREGYSLKLAGTITAAFSTADHQRMYVVDAGTLKAMAGPATAVTLQAGLASAAMHWAEINEQVFFNNGTDSGIIAPDNAVLPWSWPTPGTPTLAAVTGALAAGQYQVRCAYLLPDGRRTGAGEPAQIELAGDEALRITDIPQVAGYTTEVYVAPANSTVFQLAATPSGTAMVWNGSPDELGEELVTAHLSPLPAGCDVIQAWRGRIFAAQYFPEANQSAIWASQPLGFHLFSLDTDVFLVPGRVLMLAPHAQGLIVGTDAKLHAYTTEGALVELAPYGVVPGQHWAEDDDKRALFWSQRGLCAALPFENLTQGQISVAPGTHASATIRRRGGERHYVVSLHAGGTAFNPYQP